MANSSLTTQNPYAPQALNTLRNIVQDPSRRVIDLDQDYVYEVAMTANQSLTDQVQPVDTDSNFLWRAEQIVLSTGAFSVRFADSAGRYLSNGQIHSAAYLVGGVRVIKPRSPQIEIPAGGAIRLDITNLTGVANTIQIVFKGVKRYTLPAS